MTRGCRTSAGGSMHWPRRGLSTRRKHLRSCRRVPSATGSLGGVARGGAVAAEGSCRGKMCWITSVCCCTAENCWAKSSTVSPNSTAWEMGASRKRTLSASLISARLSHSWRFWATSADIALPRDRALTFVDWRAKSVAERSSCINPGWCHPRACL